MAVQKTRNVGFRGTLLQKRSKIGVSYVFLMFRTDAGLRICLSKNHKLVQSMLVGTIYQVRGDEYTRGDKSYLNIAKVSTVVSRTTVLKRRLGYASGFASIVVLAGVLAFGHIKSSSISHNNQTNKSPSVLIETTKPTKTPTTTTRVQSILGQTPAPSPKPTSGSYTFTPSYTTAPNPSPTPTPAQVPDVPAPTVITPTPDPTPTPPPPPPVVDPTPPPAPPDPVVTPPTTP